IAVELDVAEPERPRLLLSFLVRRHLLELGEIRQAEERVVVDVELRVAGEHRAVLLNEQRVDLDEGRVGLPVYAVKAPSDVGYRLALRGRHLGCEHERTRFERQETEERARPAARDRLGSRRGHLFYVHAADRR